MGAAVHHVLELPTDLPPPLPPSEAWKINPDKLKSFYVPTDDRGFVIAEAAIETVLSYFEDDYEWPVDWSKAAPQILKPDDHHFHWVAARYKKSLFTGKHSSVPAKFRDLPTNRGIVPRQFHNVIHKYTLPPEVPNLSDMVHYLESFEIASQLFRSAERAMILSGLLNQAGCSDEFERYAKRYDEVFASYSKTASLALDTGALEVIGEDGVNIESLSEVVQRLGSCALRNTPNYTTDYFGAENKVA
ncbi:hypothetical protein B7Y94_02730 [Candidatus Saccharibacteria bacterium 32-49-12]|nr:MAG: hypothetical protein B7Y94_02730 [Candidatus Saccharibacteria bacterium 32-49-12]